MLIKKTFYETFSFKFVIFSITSRYLTMKVTKLKVNEMEESLYKTLKIMLTKRN